MTAFEQNKDILRWPSGRIDFGFGCAVMGVLNVTDDSFSDGGQFVEVDAAVRRGMEIAAEGASVLDIGGESTRPGSRSVPPSEQIGRVVPVIERLAGRIEIPISIDTRHPDVAIAALDAGAAIINDVSALADAAMAGLAADRRVPVVLMHMPGEPATMQRNPCYADVVSEVLDFLIERAGDAEAAGIERDLIFIDPGIGFGKTLEHNLSLLAGMDRFVDTGYRVLVGTSRKNFIGQLTGRSDPAERIYGTAATAALCAWAGVSIVRVHDVAAICDVVRVTNAVRKAR